MSHCCRMSDARRACGEILCLHSIASEILFCSTVDHWFHRVPPFFARHHSREYQPCELQLRQEHFWSDEAEGCRRGGRRRSPRAPRAITGRVTRVAIDVNSPLAVDPRVMFRPPSRTRLAAVGCTSRHVRLPPRNEADSWADSPSPSRSLAGRDL